MPVTITPIRRPGVDVIQQVTAASPTIGSPALVPVVVGPNIQVLDAIDSNSNLVAAALATGTFGDNLGDLDYAIPGLSQGAILDALTIQPYLVYGATRQALSDVNDETVILHRVSTGSIGVGDPDEWNDAGATFIASGVAVGDQIEFTVNTVTHRLVVAAVTSETELAVYYNWTLSDVVAQTYTIKRNGADFEVDTNPVAATLSQGTAAARNDLVYTAVAPGTGGNSITIEVADPATASASLTVNRTGNVLQVLLATNGAGDVTSTAEDVLAAVNGAASLNTAGAPFTAAADEAITFRSALNGATAGAAITITIATPAAGAIIIAVVGTAITITPSSDGGGSTAIAICTAVNADPGASALVGAFPTGAGTTAVTNTGGPTALSGGSDSAQGATFLVNFTTTAAFGAEAGGPTWTAEGAPTLHGALSLASGSARANTVTIYEDRVGIATVTAAVYIGYEALRLDTTAIASLVDTGNDAELTVISGSADITTLLGPHLTPRNPLAYATSLAVANAPTSTVSALGISETTTAAPNGTSAAYALAFEFLESREVYTIVPLTQTASIHTALRTHVLAMSAPAERGERVGIVNQVNPTFTANETITSGTGHTATGTPLDTFGASVDFVADGVVITTDYLQIANVTGPDTLPNGAGTGWQITSAVAATVGVDGSVTALPATSTTSTWSILRVGVAITTAAVRAQAIAEIGHGFLTARMVHVVPDTVEVLISGVSQLHSGFYACAAISGQVAEQKPSQGFTNLPIAGLVGVRGSHDSFTKAQLDLIAGGGNYILIQDSAAGPVYCRHQLTTDYRTIEAREFNIQKQLDFSAKFYRSGLQAYIGVFNITNAFMDTLAAVIEGLSSYLGREQHLRKKPRLISIVQDTVAPDSLLVTLEGEILYPGNYFQLTLLV